MEEGGISIHANNPAYRLDSRYTWLLKQNYNGYQFPEEKPTVLNILTKGLEIDESLYIHPEDKFKMYFKR
jgi:hypothetical protein